MKKKYLNKFFFLFFLTFIVILPTACVAVTEVANPTITADHLSVRLGSFAPQVTMPKSNKLQIVQGGYDLVSFINLGRYSYDEVSNQILYKAKARFEFELTAYTTASPHDVDPNFKVDNYVSREFLKVDKFSWIYDPNRKVTSYHIKYYEIDFSIKDKQEYSGYIPATIEIKNTIGFGGTRKIDGYTFTMPALEYDVMSVSVASLRQGIAGDKSDILIDFTGTREGKLKIYSATQETANKEVMDYINKKANIGWKAGPTTDYITLQNWEVSGAQVGAVLDSIDPAKNTYKIPIHLKPEISIKRQYNTITWASIWWDYVDTWLISPKGMGFYAGPSTIQVPRTVAVKVVNHYIHYVFNVDMDLYMTVQPDHVLSSTELNDPFYALGDWVWDASVQGDVPTLAEDTVTWDLIGGVFNIIWTILIIIIVAIAIYLFARIGVPLLIRKFKKSKKRRR